MEQLKSPAIGFWCCVVLSLSAGVYLGGYAIARGTGGLKRHMIGNAEAQYYWISGPHSPSYPVGDASVNPVVRVLEFVFRPLCKVEGKYWTWLLSEEEDLSWLPLPTR